MKPLPFTLNKIGDSLSVIALFADIMLNVAVAVSEEKNWILLTGVPD